MMIVDKTGKAAVLLDYFGEIDDDFLEEADLVDIAASLAVRKRMMRYGTLAAAASVGIAVTYWFIRSKKMGGVVGNILGKSA